MSKVERARSAWTRPLTKATGRTKYYEDRMPAGALYVRIKHSPHRPRLRQVH